MMKGRRRRLRLKIALAFGFILAIIAVTWLGMNIMNIRDFSSQIRLLNEFHLPPSYIFEIDHYAYWNDVLKYTDGYEILQINVDPEKWETPEVWNVGEVTLFEIVQPYGLGFSSALYDEMNSGEIPSVWQEWFVSEKKPNGNFDGWEFFVGAYDGDQTLLLYRGHHLYGDSALRITE